LIRRHNHNVARPRSRRSVRRPPPRTPHTPSPARRRPSRPRPVSRITRAKLSAARLAYARTGLTKAERELAHAVAKVARARATLAALQARAVRISSAAQKSRATWAAVRAIAVQERVTVPDARTLHKTRLAAAREIAKHRQRPFVWQATPGTEEYVFHIKTTVPDLPGHFPPNSLALAAARLEYWPAGMFQGIVKTELVSVPFQTGATYDEFWRNYHDAMRPFIRAFLIAQGLDPNLTPTHTAYSVASIQAA
jgi:hypothetical protein